MSLVTLITTFTTNPNKTTAKALMRALASAQSGAAAGAHSPPKKKQSTKAAQRINVDDSQQFMNLVGPLLSVLLRFPCQEHIEVFKAFLNYYFSRASTITVCQYGAFVLLQLEKRVYSHDFVGAVVPLICGKVVKNKIFGFLLTGCSQLNVLSQLSPDDRKEDHDMNVRSNLITLRRYLLLYQHVKKHHKRLQTQQGAQVHVLVPGFADKARAIVFEIKNVAWRYFAQLDKERQTAQTQLGQAKAAQAKASSKRQRQSTADAVAKAHTQVVKIDKLKSGFVLSLEIFFSALGRFGSPLYIDDEARRILFDEVSRDIYQAQYRGEMISHDGSWIMLSLCYHQSFNWASFAAYVKSLPKGKQLYVIKNSLNVFSRIEHFSGRYVSDHPRDKSTTVLLALFLHHFKAYRDEIITFAQSFAKSVDLSGMLLSRSKDRMLNNVIPKVVSLTDMNQRYAFKIESDIKQYFETHRENTKWIPALKRLLIDGIIPNAPFSVRFVLLQLEWFYKEAQGRSDEKEMKRIRGAFGQYAAAAQWVKNYRVFEACLAKVGLTPDLFTCEPGNYPHMLSYMLDFQISPDDFWLFVAQHTASINYKLSEKELKRLLYLSPLKYVNDSRAIEFIDQCGVDLLMPGQAESKGDDSEEEDDLAEYSKMNADDLFESFFHYIDNGDCEPDAMKQILLRLIPYLSDIVKTYESYVDVYDCDYLHSVLLEFLQFYNDYQNDLDPLEDKAFKDLRDLITHKSPCIFQLKKGVQQLRLDLMSDAHQHIWRSDEEDYVALRPGFVRGVLPSLQTKLIQRIMNTITCSEKEMADWSEEQLNDAFQELKKQSPRMATFFFNVLATLRPEVHLMQPAKPIATQTETETRDVFTQVSMPSKQEKEAAALKKQKEDLTRRLEGALQKSAKVRETTEADKGEASRQLECVTAKRDAALSLLTEARQENRCLSERVCTLEQQLEASHQKEALAHSEARRVRSELEAARRDVKRIKELQKKQAQKVQPKRSQQALKKELQQLRDKNRHLQFCLSEQEARHKARERALLEVNEQTVGHHAEAVVTYKAQIHAMKGIIGTLSSERDQLCSQNKMLSQLIAKGQHDLAAVISAVEAERRFSQGDHAFSSRIILQLKSKLAEAQELIDRLRDTNSRLNERLTAPSPLSLSSSSATSPVRFVGGVPAASQEGEASSSAPVNYARRRAQSC